MNLARIPPRYDYRAIAGGADGPPAPQAAPPALRHHRRKPSPTATMSVMTPAASPLTGAQYEIAEGDYLAVVTELGAGLRELRHRDRPLIVAYQADELPPGAAGQLLVPWPNRIDGGRYLMAGTAYQLDLSEPA